MCVLPLSGRRTASPWPVGAATSSASVTPRARRPRGGYFAGGLVGACCLIAGVAVFVAFAATHGRGTPGRTPHGQCRVPELLLSKSLTTREYC